MPIPAGPILYPGGYGTTQPAVIDLLLVGIRAALTDQSQLVTDGFPAGSNEPVVMVSVGGTSEATADGTQSWAYLGAKSRFETYKVAIIVSVSLGGDGQQLAVGADAQKAARDLAYSVVHAIEQFLVGDPTLGQFFNTGPRGGGWIGIEDMQLKQTDDSTAAIGSIADIHLTAKVFAIISSAPTGMTMITQLITTPGSGLYIVPAAATMVQFECFGGCGGGGGGAVTPVNSDAWGGGGGAGGGRTVKWVEAAALRAAYPSGVPYTVGGGGAGGAPGVAGGAGGYTFAGDFVVATPGQGGFPGGIGSVGLPLTPGLALGGANGTGDSYGGAGGTGGGLNTDMGDRGLILYDGTWNGSIGGFQVIGNSGNVTVEVVQLGGGGGGGGGGGISPSPLPGGIFPTVVANTPGNGGNSGFASTADPTPLAGSGGIVGGALPTSAGVSVIAGAASQGGGGGGAASLSGDAQSGANALLGSRGGGGGGGSCRTGHTAGSGGSGDAGFMRITTF